jgi:transposase-like protein
MPPSERPAQQRPRISQSKIRDIRHYYRRGVGTRDIAEIVGVNRKTVLKYTRNLSPVDKQTHIEKNREINRDVQRARARVRSAGGPVRPRIVYVRELIGLAPFPPEKRERIPKPEEFTGARKPPSGEFVTVLSPRPHRLYEAVRLYDEGWSKEAIARALQISPNALRGIEKFAPHHAEKRKEREEQYKTEARYVARRLGISYRDALRRVRRLSEDGLIIKFSGDLDSVLEAQDAAAELYGDAYDEVEGTWPWG